MDAKRPRDDLFGIAHMMILIAGIAVGLWLTAKDIKSNEDENAVFLALVAVLGGISVVGVPMMIYSRFFVWKQKRRLSPGETLWFSTGVAAWFLWPPLVASRIRGNGIGDDSGAAVCFWYGTPLMALFMFTTLVAGGWIRRGRRVRSWRDRIGLFIGVVWACTGLYVLSLIYRGKF